MSEYKIKLLQKYQAADNTPVLVCDKPENFDFNAGQFVILEILSPAYSDDRGSSRPLSIASSPTEDVLEFSFRRGVSAFKRSADELKGGETLSIKGPFGHMKLPEDPQTPAVFLAGGIGITPIRSMLKQEYLEKSPRQTILFYSNHTPCDAPFFEEINKLCDGPNRRVVHTMTDAPDWRGQTGFIDAAMIARNVSDQILSEAQFYISGTDGFVTAMRQILLSLNIDPSRINCDNFGSPDKGS